MLGGEQGGWVSFPSLSQLSGCAALILARCLPAEVVRKVNGLISAGQYGRLFAVVHFASKQWKITSEDLIMMDNVLEAECGDRIRMEKVKKPEQIPCKPSWRQNPLLVLTPRPKVLLGVSHLHSSPLFCSNSLSFVPVSDVIVISVQQGWSESCQTLWGDRFLLS